jgi:hypothetical protein
MQDQIELFQTACRALGVDTPVMDWQVDGDRLTLYLYGGGTAAWQIPPETAGTPAQGKNRRTEGAVPQSPRRKPDRRLP